MLDAIKEQTLLTRANEIGQTIRNRIEELMLDRKGTPVANLRGLGAMLAFDTVKSHGGSEPDGPAAKRVAARALERGLIVLTCGTFGETVRILVPLTIGDADLREGLETLCEAVQQGG